MALFENWWRKSYTDIRQRLSLHVLFWVAYLCFLGSTAFEHLRTNSNVAIPGWLLGWMMPVYLVWVYYFLVGTAYRSLRRKQSARALLFGLGSFLLYVHSDLLYSWILAGRIAEAGVATRQAAGESFGVFYERSILSWFAVFHFLFGFVVYLIMPVLCKAFRDLQRSHQRFRELKERNMLLELNLIKSQVNPHFLLNTLNNIYGLTITGTKQQIGEMVLNLSGFLKYSLYECSNEFITLDKEIKLIESYVALEQVRSDYIDVSLDIQTDKGSYNLPPFVLFPLVENAFKHGTRNLSSPTHISMKLIVKHRHLSFVVENDLQPQGKEEGGFGLQALRKKLEHYYPNSSALNTIVAGDRYITQLQIMML